MHSRNAGLQRLRSITKRVGIATTVLTGIFAGLAAAGNSGHHARRAATRLPTRRPAAVRKTTSVPAPPSLPPLRSGGFAGGDEGSQSQPASPQPVSPQSPVEPQAPPVVTQQPPVTSSGGS